MIESGCLFICLFMTCCETPPVENHCDKTNMSQHEARKQPRPSPCVVPKESKHQNPKVGQSNQAALAGKQHWGALTRCFHPLCPSWGGVDGCSKWKVWVVKKYAKWKAKKKGSSSVIGWHLPSTHSQTGSERRHNSQSIPVRSTCLLSTHVVFFFNLLQF